MEREYTPRLLTPYCVEQIVCMAKSLGIGKDLYHLLFGADYVLAYYRMVGDSERYFQEVFEMIYLLKYGGGNLTLSGVLAKGNDALDMYPGNKFSFHCEDKKLQKKILKLLESSIDNETKDMYYNFGVIEELPEPEGNDKIFDCICGIVARVKAGDLSEDDGQRLKDKYESMLLSSPDRYDNFFYEDSLGKIIRYQRKEAAKFPKQKQQIIGYYANMLFEWYKYDVFGYSRPVWEFIESPVCCVINAETGEEERYYDPQEYEAFVRETEKQKQEMAEFDESSTALLSLYRQYVFIYDVLHMLGIIRESKDTNKEEYRYIRDSLRSYHRFCDVMKRPI
jgi:hypothetical protein